MRRRNLLTVGGVKVTLSSYSQTVEPNASSISITAYANGTPITDATSSMLTKDGSKVTSTTINSSGVITISYNRNTSTSSSKSGWIKFTYKEQTVQFNLTQSKDYVTSTSISSTYTNSRNVVTTVNYNGYNGVALMPASYCKSYVDFRNCTGTTYTTYYHYLYAYYKSGNYTTTEVTERETQTPSTSLYATFTSSTTYNLVVGKTYTGTFYFGSDKVSATVTITRTDEKYDYWFYGNVIIAHNGSIVVERSDEYIDNVCPD